MCYRGSRGVVPTEGIRPGQMTVKFRGWPRDMVTQMCLWHIVMAEPLYKRHPLPRQIALEHMSMSYRRGQSRKSMTRQENIGLTRYRLLSVGAVRRNSLCCAPFDPPTVSCVLAPPPDCPKSPRETEIPRTPIQG